MVSAADVHAYVCVCVRVCVYLCEVGGCTCMYIHMCMSVCEGTFVDNVELIIYVKRP